METYRMGMQKVRSDMTSYRCRHCGKTVKRDSIKAWIKSYCSETGKDVRLQRVENSGAVRHK